MIIRTRKSYKKRGRCFGSAAPPNAAAQTFASDGATDRNRLQFDYAFDEAEPSGGICVSIFAGFDPLPPASQTGSWAANPRGWQPYFWRPI